MEPIILIEKEQLEEIHFDKENPFIRIISVTSEMDLSDGSGLMLKYKVDRGNGKSFEDSIDLEYDHKNKKFYGGEKLQLDQAKRVYLFFKTDETVSDLQIEYELLDRLPVQIPTVGFNEHLADSRNVKIFFSAPFGQGKSTFLEQYFSEREKDYRVFKLFPVNYSVANNADIFEYIKCELILQLMEQLASFKTEEFSFSENALTYLNTHGIELAKNLLGLASKMELTDQYEHAGLVLPLLKLSEFLQKSREKFKKRTGISELSKAKGFLVEFNKMKSGLFESDYYTQLIRDLLVRFKEEEPKKENILIIDDLDRLDPDHIFRILNVFSAHYDSFHQRTTQGNNKFGFDRIMLVGDINNIRKIYAHRYGKDVDFDGYMNKYSSTKPFSYKNADVMLSLVKDIDASGQALQHLPSIYLAFDLLVKPIVKTERIALRAILDLRKVGLLKTAKDIEKNQNFPNEIRSSRWSATIYMLLDTLGYEGLIESISVLSNLEEFKHKENLKNCCVSLMYIKLKGDSKATYFHNHKANQFTISFDYGYDNTSSDKFWPKDIKIIDDKQKDVSNEKVFTIEHFKELLKDVVKEIHSTRYM